MDYTTLFLVAYLFAVGFFVALLIIFSNIEKEQDKYKMRPYRRLW